MSLQAINSLGKSYLYVPSACLDSVLYQEGDNILIRLTKDNCKVYLLEAFTKVCADKIEVLLDIQACIDVNGRWEAELLTLSKEHLHTIDVIVHAHKIYK